MSTKVSRIQKAYDEWAETYDKNKNPNRDLSFMAFRVLNTNTKLFIAELHPYKQLQNSQAKFTSQKSGEEVLVDAFDQFISEFINMGINVGFIFFEN